MSVLLLEEPWATQPHVVVGPPKVGPYARPDILWSASTPGLNLADRVPTSIVGTGVNMVPFKHGSAMHTGGYLDSGKILFNNVADEGDEVTFVWVGYLSPSFINTRLFSSWDEISTGRYELYMDNTYSRWRFLARKSTTTASRVLNGLSTSSPIVDGVLVISYKDGETPVAYYNGVALWTSVSSAGSGPLISSAQTVALSGLPTGLATNRQPVARVSAFARYGRAFSAAECRAMNNAKACWSKLFAPQELVLPGYLAAGGPPTLTNILGVSTGPGEATITVS